MKIRKITSLTSGLAFIVMLVTSIILYIVPQGRVAYWADWKLWGLTKTDWGNIQINLGLLFLISLFLHIYYNWKPLIAYLKDKSKRVKIFTPEFNAAIVISTVFILGTYMMLPPFSWVISLNDHFKDSGAVKYGEPPYGHAELSSLKTFAKKLNLDLAKSMELLKEAGYPVDDSMVTVQAIGKQFNVPPQLIYETIKPASIDSGRETVGETTLPDSPPPGTSNLTLADFCAQYNLNIKRVIRELKGEGITASEDLTLKQIASNNQTGPIDLFEIIINIAKV
jgi:hypothetical protein